VLCEGFLDEPVLLTRDDKDALHCLANVCTHRGNLVAEKPGRLKSLRCAYHGRRFGLDGTFQFMPEFDGVCGFPCEKDNMARVPFAEWRGLIFASADPAMPFDEWIAPVERRIAGLPTHAMAFDGTRSRDYLVRANWALYCDNYLEGFHIPYVHAGLAAVLDYEDYSSELSRYANLQLGIAKGGDECIVLPPGSPDAGRDVAGYYFWLFPNLMVNIYPWGISINIVKPLEPARSKISYLTYVWDPSKLDKGAGSSLDRVEREDEAVVEAVQRGVQSRFYDRGRYSPKREQCVHHFHRLLAEFLGDRC